MAEKQKTVAVFMYDGTEKYSNMTINAIKSFLAASQGIFRNLAIAHTIFLPFSKGITIGILVPPTLNQPDWTSVLGSEVKLANKPISPVNQNMFTLHPHLVSWTS